MFRYLIIILLATSCMEAAHDNQQAQVKAIIYSDYELHPGLAGARIFEDKWKIGFLRAGDM